MTFEETVESLKRFGKEYGIDGLHGGCDLMEYRWIWDLITRRAERDDHEPGIPFVEGGLLVELGVSNGVGTAIMAEASKRKNLTVWGVDIFQSGLTCPNLETEVLQRNQYHEGLQNLVLLTRWLWENGLRNRVRFFIGDTISALRDHLNAPVCYAMLDAGKRNMVQADEWDLIAPRVVPGGVIAIHDSCDNDPIESFQRMEATGAWIGWQEILDHPPLKNRDDHIPWECGWRTRAWRKLHAPILPPADLPPIVQG